MSMSNLRSEFNIESEVQGSAPDLITSQDYSYNDFINSNKDLLLSSFSVTSPTDHNLKIKSKMPNEYERIIKEKKKIDKENYILSENLRKSEALSDTLRKENLKLRTGFEKSEYQKNGYSNMLQKINEESKQKSEQIKKQNEHIKKLESQLLKGSLHHNMYEENKRLKENLSNLEDDNRDKSDKIIELSERLVRASQEVQLYKSAAEVNLIELNEHFESGGLEFKDLVSFAENKTHLEAAEEENKRLRDMLDENSRVMDGLNKELYSQNEKIAEYETEIARYKSALEVSEKQSQTFRKGNQESLLRETTLNEKINTLEDQIVQSKAAVEDEVKRADLNAGKYEELLRQHTQLSEEFELVAKKGDELKETNAKLEGLVESQKRLVESSEKRQETTPQKQRLSSMKEELDAKEKLVKEKTMQIEHLVMKLRGYDRDMKELFERNVKQEEAIMKYQEVIEFSQDFIQKMEQRFNTMVIEDQSSKNLKVEIHRMIESCIKRMLSDSPRK